MSVCQQLQMQEINFSLKMEDKYLRQLGGFVDLLLFLHTEFRFYGHNWSPFAAAGSGLAVLLLFWYYFALSYLCLAESLIEIYDVIATPGRLSAQYHFFPLSSCNETLLLLLSSQNLPAAHCSYQQSAAQAESSRWSSLLFSCFFLWIVCLSFSVCDWCLTGKPSGGHTDLTALLAAIDSFSLKP